MLEEIHPLLSNNVSLWNGFILIILMHKVTRNDSTSGRPLASDLN